MAFIFEAGKHPFRYIYCGFSYRDADGEPRNQRVRVGRVDRATGARIFSAGVVGAREISGYPIPEEIRRRIAEEDRDSRARHPQFYGRLTSCLGERPDKYRKGKGPVFRMEDLDTVTLLEAGVFPLLERAGEETGFLGALRRRARGAWEGVFALGAFLAARDEGLAAAGLWLSGTDGPEADLSAGGILGLLEGITSGAACGLALDTAGGGGPESQVLYCLGGGEGEPAVLPVGTDTLLPCGPLGPPPRRAPGAGAPDGESPEPFHGSLAVRPPFPGGPPGGMEGLLEAVGGGSFLCEAPPGIRRGGGGVFRIRRSAGDSRPLWLLVDKGERGGRPRAAVSDRRMPPEMAFAHLGHRALLERTRAEALARLADLLGPATMADLADGADVVVFTALFLASLVARAARSSPGLKGLPHSEILRQMGGVRRVGIARIRYVKALSPIQAEIFRAFGVNDWELRAISGQAYMAV
ncbi:MAG: hypothetical protein LBG06_11805 [Deltaproteobacteria bacterium]|jgi:hypothetical protein|nr:hypothetical protein [Deltaproteobacteria bacterium]